MQVKQNKPYSLKTADRLWRYTDLHQLLYFLNTETIFFAPLSSFDDPLEGISEKYLLKRNLPPGGKLKPTGRLERIQQHVYASCWFLGDTESMAMWETHSNADSVAIEFEAKRLVKLVTTEAKKYKTDDFCALYHGKVDYIKLSPAGSKISKQKQKPIGFLKDKSYKHEEEFRFIVLQSKKNKKILRGFDLPAGSLKQLDFSIVTHPNMEKWKYNNLAKMLSNFSLQDKLKRSHIITR
jgi:hypothetical protein